MHESEEGVLSASLLVVSGLLLPLPPTDLLTRTIVRLRGLERDLGLRDEIAVVEGGITTLAPRVQAAA